MSEVTGHAGRPGASRLGRGWRGWLLSLLGLCLLAAGNVRGDGVALNFFTNTADRLIRFSTARWYAQDPVDYANTFGGITNGFSLTNIPVRINGKFVYTPAVNRLLQVSANLYEATTNTFYPAVYRPSFYVDGNSNVFITGYHQIDSPVTPGVPPLDQAITINALPAGFTSGTQANSFANVFGIPWIIGAKKYLPNFNQFYMENLVQVTRKLQVNRLKIEGWNSKTTAPDFSTNQLFIMSITNRIGCSFWNSYQASYPGGQPIIYARDICWMILTNGSGSVRLEPVTNLFYYNNLASGNSATNWPGASWNLTFAPMSRPAATNSFYYSEGDFDLLQPEIYSLASQTLNPLPWIGSPFNTNDTSIQNLDQFGLVTSNWFQAYIVDSNQVIDYVQFYGPNSTRNLNNELFDHYPGANLSPYDMWYTNASGSSFTGPYLGLFNQINVSQAGTGLPPGSWTAPPNLPAGLAPTVANEAVFFRAFFTGAPFTYNGQVYINTNLSQQAPFTPTRTMAQITVWQANDPLVHYLASDLSDLNPFTGLIKSDDPSLTAQPIPTVSPNSIGQSVSGIIRDDRYQPWDVVNQLALLVNTDKTPYNMAYRDPLVYGSDDWDFPTNMTGPDWLGRVHRGTPWQTIYLKATNILYYVNPSIPANGFVTWTNWMNDGIPIDAVNAAPENDHDLMIPLMELFNTNDIRTLMGVNDPAPADWLGQLDGLDVLTNTTLNPLWDSQPILFDDLIVSSNSATATALYNAIQTARSAQPGGYFRNIGDLLQTPQLAEQSPFLNITNGSIPAYSISDEAYERIPAQLLYRVRADSIGSMAAVGGQMTVQFTGADGYAYAIQVSPDLVNWTSVSTNCPMNDTITITVPAGLGAQYYRSVLMP